MEKEYNIHKTNIMWPQPKNGIVAVDTSVDFAYIMRKDGQFTMNPIALTFAQDYMLDPQATQQIFLQEYDMFTAHLTETLLKSFSHKGSVELHIYDPDILDKHIRAKASNLHIISLDPLMRNGVYTHGVSRGYYLSGQQDFGQVARPGMESLEKQAENIATVIDGNSGVIAEDDIFSGGSVIASIEGLTKKGVTINHLISGIQVGKPKKLAQMGIPVKPIIQYETTDGTNIFDKVDLGDPRDYLVGASGLVVKLPNGTYGRVPYVLPFVSASARAGIPKEAEKKFSLQVLQANKQFFTTLEEKTGKSVLLKHMHPDFVTLMHDFHNFDHQTPMQHVINWAMESIDTTWHTYQEVGSYQERLEKLLLPKNIVLLDVNGTLIPDGSADEYISIENIEKLQQQNEKLKGKNISVGLCSDSPLPQLQQMAQKLGITGPIIAENGNVIAHNGSIFIVDHVPQIENMKKEIEQVATSMNLQKEKDRIAPEFDGGPIITEDNTWAFGANRLTSLSVFGSHQFIQKLAELPAARSYSIDCSPEYGYFAIHPGTDFRKNKGNTLAFLAAYGHNVLMVGNSMSDWVDNRNVACAFVAESRITEKVKDTVYVSDKPTIEGVIDILEKIQ